MIRTFQKFLKIEEFCIAPCMWKRYKAKVRRSRYDIIAFSMFVELETYTNSCPPIFQWSKLQFYHFGLQHKTMTTLCSQKTLTTVYSHKSMATLCSQKAITTLCSLKTMTRLCSQKTLTTLSTHKTMTSLCSHKTLTTLCSHRSGRSIIMCKIMHWRNSTEFKNIFIDTWKEKKCFRHLDNALLNSFYMFLMTMNVFW